MFANGPERHLAELEAQAREFTQRGVQPSQALLDKIAEQKERVQANEQAAAQSAKERADAKAAEAAAVEARREAEMKSAALDAFLNAGGVPADFEAQWPALRAKVVEQRTLDQLQSSNALVERKRRAYSGF